ncbi:chaplin family protein [Actinomadura sp. 9N215]|uniref:chaplin family protein n=1 Tax=Actinomadura sp. 9N215 TaxID=3375150 RepID=UPI0037A32F1D
MRMWARNTGRAALLAAGAVAIGAAFGSGAVADTTSGDSAAALRALQAQARGGAETANARHGGGGDMQTSGNFSIAGGNQVRVPISIPVDVCGNAIAIIGLAKAQCKGGAKVSSHRESGDGWEGSGYRSATGQEDRGSGWDLRHGGGGGGMETSGNFSVLGGNQVYAPISIPIDVCGNAIAVLGLAKAQCKGGASVERKGHGDPKMKTSGNFSILGGNQVYAPISIPVNVCGNAIAVLGLAEAQCKGGASVGGGHDPLPPTLRTPPKKKVYKPSKHRPAAGHKKLPSTLREENSRMARPSTTTSTTTDYRKADRLPGVQRFIDGLKRSVKVPGVDVKPGKIGPKLSTKDGLPVKVGSPVLK